MNCSSINNVELELNIEPQQSQIRITVVNNSINQLRTMEGVAGLVYRN